MEGTMDNRGRPLDIFSRLFEFLSNSLAARAIKRLIRVFFTNHGAAKKSHVDAHDTTPMSKGPSFCALTNGIPNNESLLGGADFEHVKEIESSSSSPIVAPKQDDGDQGSKSNPAKASNEFHQGEKSNNSNNNNNMDSSTLIQSTEVQDKHALEILVPQEPKPQDHDEPKKGVTKVLSASKKTVSFKDDEAEVMPATPKKTWKKSKKLKQAIEPEIEEPTVLTSILKRTNSNDVDETSSHVFIQSKN
ncbi:hypothetical protein Scep_030511 [Stephania cephalantha]|uniref:Uncharacterized protein n=1 Tax=Stephania cephalantha TaxID=152367 RepID=A0AAP0DZQ9_9MAGN